MKPPIASKTYTATAGIWIVDILPTYRSNRRYLRDRASVLLMGRIRVQPPTGRGRVVVKACGREGEAGG